MKKGDYPSSRIELSDPLPSVHAARSLRRRRDAELGWGVHARSRGRAARPACPFEYAVRQLANVCPNVCRMDRCPPKLEPFVSGAVQTPFWIKGGRGQR